MLLCDPDRGVVTRSIEPMNHVGQTPVALTVLGAPRYFCGKEVNAPKILSYTGHGLIGGRVDTRRSFAFSEAWNC